MGDMSVLESNIGHVAWVRFSRNPNYFRLMRMSISAYTFTEDYWAERVLGDRNSANADRSRIGCWGQ